MIDSVYEDCVYDASGFILCTYNGAPFQATPNDTPDQWAEIMALVASGDLVVAPYIAPPPPPPPTPEELWAQMRQNAGFQLMVTDAMIPKIVEAVILGKNSFTGVDVVAFANWREALRTVSAAATGDPSVPLPAQPADPVGI